MSVLLIHAAVLIAFLLVWCITIQIVCRKPLPSSSAREPFAPRRASHPQRTGTHRRAA